MSLGTDEAIFKDLALTGRSVRGVDCVDRRVCLSAFRGELRSRQKDRPVNGVKNLYGSKVVPKDISLLEKKKCFQ